MKLFKLFLRALVQVEVKLIRSHSAYLLMIVCDPPNVALIVKAVPREDMLDPEGHPEVVLSQVVHFVCREGILLNELRDSRVLSLQHVC